MKVLIYNDISNMLECLDCNYIRMDKERIFLAGIKNVSILKKNKNISDDYKYKITKSFLENKQLTIKIKKESIIIE